MQQWKRLFFAVRAGAMYEARLIVQLLFVVELRIKVVGSERCVTEAGDKSGTRRKWDTRHSKPLKSNGY
jgi:hypothetical protein